MGARSRPGDLIGLSRRATPAGRVHFPQAERHDRFSGGQKAARKVGGRLAALTVTASPVPIRSGDRGAAAGVGRPALPGCFDWQRLGNRVCRPLPWMDWGGPAGIGSVANRSALHPTRLETRTKESNMRASRWVVRNPKAK